MDFIRNKLSLATMKHINIDQYQFQIIFHYYIYHINMINHCQLDCHHTDILHINHIKTVSFVEIGFFCAENVSFHEQKMECVLHHQCAYIWIALITEKSSKTLKTFQGTNQIKLIPFTSILFVFNTHIISIVFPLFPQTVTFYGLIIKTSNDKKHQSEGRTNLKNMSIK